MNIRKMIGSDKCAVMDMMRTFYASPAVHTNGSDEIFESDVNACVDECPFLEGYVFEENGNIVGYAMTAKSFSTEFGKPCIWIEDIYFKPEHRGKGFGKSFFAFLDKTYRDVIFRLEAEEENGSAVALYKKCGFEIMPYLELKKEI